MADLEVHAVALAVDGPYGEGHLRLPGTHQLFAVPSQVGEVVDHHLLGSVFRLVAPGEGDVIPSFLQGVFTQDGHRLGIQLGVIAVREVAAERDLLAGLGARSGRLLGVLVIAGNRLFGHRFGRWCHVWLLFVAIAIRKTQPYSNSPSQSGAHAGLPMHYQGSR